jgi:upstream activation factor subunit UAF30
VQLSTELSEFFNTDILSRTEVTKQIWAYIKSNHLQNSNDEGEILCDEKLERIFKIKKMNTSKMTKVLSQVNFLYLFLSKLLLFYF